MPTNFGDESTPAHSPRPRESSSVRTATSDARDSLTGIPKPVTGGTVHAECVGRVHTVFLR